MSLVVFFGPCLFRCSGANGFRRLLRGSGGHSDDSAQRGSTRLNPAAELVLPVFAKVARDASDAEIKKAYRKDLETWDLHGFFNGFFNGNGGIHRYLGP